MAKEVAKSTTMLVTVRAVAHAFGQVDTLLDTAYIPSIENISLPLFRAHFCYIIHGGSSKLFIYVFHIDALTSMCDRSVMQ